MFDCLGQHLSLLLVARILMTHGGSTPMHPWTNMCCHDETQVKYQVILPSLHFSATFLSCANTRIASPSSNIGRNGMHILLSTEGCSLLPWNSQKITYVTTNNLASYTRNLVTTIYVYSTLVADKVSYTFTRYTHTFNHITCPRKLRTLPQFMRHAPGTTM